MIEQIKQALENATPGPWEYQPGYYGRNHLVSQVETGNVVCMGKTFEKTMNDFQLIANAPEWLRYLIGEVERLEKVEKDYNALTDIMDRARKLAYIASPDENTFYMDKDGNLCRKE